MTAKIKKIRDSIVDTFNNRNDYFTYVLAGITGVLGAIYLLIALIVVRQ